MEKSAMGHFNMTAFAARGGGLYEGLVIRAYEDFGVYLFKSERVYLAVRCWPGREPFLSGHMHNDQLGIELCVDGQPVMADPGSYLYSPLPKDRDRYRSVHGHFTPWPREAEPAMLGPGLFSVLTPVKAEVLYLGYEGFVGKLAHGCGAVRSIELREDGVVVTDFADEPFKKEQKRHQTPYSPAYGLVWREFQ